MLLPHFMGQVGMRIMQRPQGASVFKDEDGNFDKDAMDEFMDRTYIENIWYFSKDKNKDIFRHKETHWRVSSHDTPKEVVLIL